MAKVGSERDEKTVGPHGLGERNECGDNLSNWFKEKNLVITSTWFNVHPRRRDTWISYGDRARNQIEYVMITSKISISGCRHTFRPQHSNNKISDCPSKCRRKRRLSPFELSTLHTTQEMRENFKQDYFLTH